MTHLASRRPADAVFTVDYDRRPFCFVRASTGPEAVRLAESLLGMALRPRGAAPIVAAPPTKERTRLRARRPTDAERCQFAATARRNGVDSPYLAAVLAG